MHFAQLADFRRLLGPHNSRRLSLFFRQRTVLPRLYNHLYTDRLQLIRQRATDRHSLRISTCSGAGNTYSTPTYTNTYTSTYAYSYSYTYTYCYPTRYQ